MTVDPLKLDNQLLLEEGLRLRPYRDSRGFTTIGVGRNLDANPLTPEEIAVCGSNGRAGPITREGAMLCLHNDEARAISLLDANIPWWKDLDEIRARVMVDLCFNMGWRSPDGKHGLSTFQHFISDMIEGWYILAGEDLQDSAWFRQVGKRGRRLVEMVQTGEDYTS